METEKLQTWLTSLITGLVAYPEDIKIDIKVDEEGVMFVVQVNKDDCGKVIGREGVIASAIRTLLRSSGRLLDVRASMKIDAGTNFSIKPEDR